MKEEKNLLSEAREKIDGIDAQMAALFCQRMEAVKQVALYKKETGMPIFDPAREEAILERGAERVEDETLRSYYASFLRAGMEISKNYQKRLLDGARVAFAGVKGAFAQIAASQIFPEAHLLGYDDFASAYRAVESGECDVAVLPLENSTGGDVGTVMDLAFFGSLHINGIYDIEVVQNLLAKPNVSLSRIRTVISHPQALSQCAPFLKKLGVHTQNAENTAMAARMVAEMADDTVAAIGSEAAAEEYGLSVLRSHIQEKGGNTTRFAVFSRVAKAPSPGDSRFVMVFTVKNEAGSLAKALSTVGESGFNLRSLKSRPTGHSSWEYYFFCEGDGVIESSEGRQMLSRLGGTCDTVKILGSFEKESMLS